MKMKSFAMLAVSGLIAASVAYVAPAMADDMTGASPAVQQPAQQAPAMPSDNSMQNQGATAQNNNTTPADSGTSNGGSDAATSSPSNTDEGGSPDTATGDDDY